MLKAKYTKPTPPSNDTRWKLLEATMRRHGYKAHSLIEVLHTAQEAFGYLDEDVMRFVAYSLHLPLSKVYGVATFYHFFTLKPQGRHTCVVCTGTACYIKGAGNLIEAIEQKYGVKPGETSEDGELSLLTARCFGCCGLAPAAVIDGEVAGKLSSAEILERIEKRVKS
ncbi:MAG: bidirectional hydrogenase complex protein HoxE [Candidatus Hydrogenedentota bacterium]|jgi:bidirectional [NiFe] hydrogenase diaphorase subunit|uniref:NAD-reducing hydrogenase subunit HoxE n=1 Tax=Sumerlaea chitinivorans TaxID=2250252 RepID=A0A2Z4Y642_SUMC1|nr:NAD-reducing hydrogenase subunit HoxE [Candidatus Sumerlaea chitinivorans]MCX7964058.1 bidirectional hydrogenase complex protein HoxE [Candidatus Sumerlaea chitinivorans]RMH30537.1 MAG: bidirectional hydrogenase complex protein HoxE [Candidatus Hydrogenedentota bacterium]